MEKELEDPCSILNFLLIFILKIKSKKNVTSDDIYSFKFYSDKLKFILKNNENLKELLNEQAKNTPMTIVKFPDGFKLNEEIKKYLDNELDSQLLIDDKIKSALFLFNVAPVFDAMSLQEILEFDINQLY
jgi:hypothetical protein